MARKAREKSSLGIYNIMLRGDDLFKTEADYDAFIECMAQYFMGDASICAYCLTDNAACFILKESENGVSSDMKPFVTSYARYCNRTRGTKGSVFTDRFKSEPINDKNYLLQSMTVMHKLYLLLNRDAYTGDDDILNGDGLCDSKTALKLIGSKKKYISAMESDDTALTPFYNVLK